MLNPLIDILNALESGHFDLRRRMQWESGLEKMGVSEPDSHAFITMIEKVTRMQSLVERVKPRGGFPIRVYSKEEKRRLNAACRGLLTRLEHKSLLPPELREMVIEQVIKTEAVEMDELRLSLVILLILFHQPNLDAMLLHYEALCQLKAAVIH